MAPRPDNARQAAETDRAGDKRHKAGPRKPAAAGPLIIESSSSNFRN